MLREKVGEVTVEVMKVTPPAGVVGLNLLGYSIAEWVQVATLFYILLQIHVLASKNVGWYGSLCKAIKEVLRGRSSKKQ